MTLAATLRLEDRIQEAHWDVTTLPVRTDIDLEKRPQVTKGEEEPEDIFDYLISGILEQPPEKEVAPDGIKFPHELITGTKFSPFYAYRDGGNGNGYVDEDYLLRNIHSESGLDYSGLSWKPQEIPAYTSTKRVYFDIETEGRDWNTEAVTAIGVKLEGDYSSVLPKYLKKCKIAEVGLIWTYSLPCHEEKKLGAKLEKMPEGDVYGVVYCEDEADMLRQALEFVDGIRCDIISMHNGFEFDCRYIVERCDIKKVYCPMTTIFTVDRFGMTKKKVNTAASMNGKPLEFYPTYWAKPDHRDKIYNNGQFPQILDTMHLAAMRDKISGDMNGYGLKYLALEYIGKRKKKRIELTYKQMMKAWKGGAEADLLQYRQYLIYDVQDQGEVTNFFAQGIWYQQMFMPLALQEISVASPARKWNAIVQSFYKPLEGKWCERITMEDGEETLAAVVIQRPQADEKVKYEGAISRVSPGIYRWFFKVDVASLYPSIMLRYKLADPKKDPLGIGLFILAQARDLRYYYKRLGNECAERGDEAGKMLYKSIDEALKVLLNGFYGFTGCGGYPYNSMATGALVTAYGRILLRMMMHEGAKYTRIIEADTDGLYCEQLRNIGPANAECVKLTESLIEKAIAKIAKLETEVATGKAEQKDLDNAKDSLKYHQERLAEMLDESLGERVIYTPEFVHHRMQSVLPNGIKLELEENEPDGVLVGPKAKNYIKFPGPDKKAKVKGLYRKRNRTVLQKDYIIEALRQRGFNGKEAMQDYVNGVINAVRTLGNQIAVENGEESQPIPLLASTHSITLELKDIVQTQRIPSNSKWLVECNMGEAGGSEKVSFYWGHQKRFGKRNQPIKGKEFPINVTISDDGTHTVQRQYLTPENDPANVSYRLDPVRYEGNYLKSIAAVQAMIDAGEARTSNMIEAPDMYLPQWYIDQIEPTVSPTADEDDEYADF